jgi:hypothetical protein
MQLAISTRVISAAVLFAAIGALRGETMFHRPPPQQEIVQGRDFKRYIDGGEFSNAPLKHGRVPRITALREFIWSHWTQKARSYVRLSLSGVDTRDTTYFFIEPDQQGRWRIHCRHLNIWAGAVGMTRWTLGNDDEIVAVERAKPKKDDRYGGGYVLVFKTKDGKEAWRL